MFLRKFAVAGFVVLALALVASGAGWLVHRPATSSVRAAPPAAKDNKKPPKAGDKKTKTPDLVREAATKALIEKQKEKAKTKAADPPPREPRVAIRKTVDFKGYDDPRTTLGEALDQLGKLHNVTFDINEQAFDDAGLKDVTRTVIIEKNPLPAIKTSLGKILSKVLSRLPKEAAATFLVRKDHIEITTVTAARKELGMTVNEPLLTVNEQFLLVNEVFRQVELSTALEDMAEATDANIIVDPRLGEKAKAKVTVQFKNVPLEIAVKLLTNMHGLGMVRLKNVLYVTSTDNATKLAKEVKEEDAKRAKEPVAPKGKAAM